MYKRIITILLALVMLLSLVACSGKGDSQKDPAKDPEKPISDVEDGEKEDDDVEVQNPAVNKGIDPNSDGGPYGNRDYSEEETLNITYAGVGMSDEVQEFSQSDAIISTIEDKFNFRFTEANSLGWTDWAETMRIWINSGDMFDVMFHPGDYLDLKSYAEQGLIRNIGDVDEFAEKYPNLNEVIKTTGISDQFVERFGGLYALPRVVYRDLPTDPLVGHQTLAMRKDWLEALGYDIKDSYTIDEVIDFGENVANATDLPAPFMSGQAFGLDSTHIAYIGQMFMYPYNLNADVFYYDEAESSYKWGAADPGTLEGLKKWQEAWKKGVVHKEFYIDTNREPTNNLSAGKVAATYDCGTGMCIFGGRTTYTSIEGNSADQLHYAAVLGNDGKTYYPETTNFWGDTIFHPDLDEAKLTRYLEMLDWLSTDAGQYLLRLGIYDEDWGYNDNAEMIIKRQANADGSYPSIGTVYPSLSNFLENMTVCTDGFSLIDPALPGEVRDSVTRTFDIKQQGDFRHIDWDLHLFSGSYYDKFSMNYYEEFAGLIASDGDLEAAWKAWVETNKPVVQKVIEELNANIQK